jgi:hypothetical protein
VLRFALVRALNWARITFYGESKPIGRAVSDYGRTIFAPQEPHKFGLRVGGSRLPFPTLHFGWFKDPARVDWAG